MFIPTMTQLAMPFDKLDALKEERGIQKKQNN
jgi:hypothetical protein